VGKRIGSLRPAWAKLVRIYLKKKIEKYGAWRCGSAGSMLIALGSISSASKREK
jgi:hypothetical protein